MFVRESYLEGLDGFSLSRFLSKAGDAITKYGGALVGGLTMAENQGFLPTGTGDTTRVLMQPFTAGAAPQQSGPGFMSTTAGKALVFGGLGLGALFVVMSMRRRR